MTGKEAMQYLGKTGTLRVRAGQGRHPDEGEHLTMHVTVRDARQVFGRVDFYVTAIAGDGGAWVAAERVRLDEKENT